MIRIAARYHKLPISVAVGLTCGLLVVVGGLLFVRPLVAPVPSVAPSSVPLASDFTGIASFGASLTALPSPPAVAPPGSAVAPVPSRPVATQPVETVGAPSPVVATSTPAPTLTSIPTVAPTFAVTPPPVTPAPTIAPTQPPVVTPEPTILPSVAVTCGNGVDNSGGLGLICDATIFAGFATILECHGAAGDPRAACSTRTFAGRVTKLDMCNGSANGGGATLRCSVTGVGFGSAPVTLCVGSGAGGTLVGMTCTWSGSSAIPVNMCNGSGNGGGALLICAVNQ